MSVFKKKPLEARFGTIGAPEHVQREFTQIPIVDLSRLSSSSVEDQKSLAADIYAVATTVGFFYIKNHGIPDEFLDDMQDTARQYFALPLETKMRQYAGTRGNEFIGYHPTSDALPHDAQEHMRVSGGSGFESLAFGYELAGDPDKAEDDQMPTDPCGLYGPNEWPDDAILPDFYPAQLRYYRCLLQFSRRLLQIFALALDVPEDSFDSLVRPHSPSICRLMHYYACNPETEPAATGAHTDICLFTILHQGGVSGLQVKNARQEWIAAPSIPGTLVVNIGDILHYSSNGIFQSTPHRGINLTGEERYSVPFFFNADYNATISCLRDCVSDDRPAITEPFVFGEWMHRQIHGVKSGRS
ncbi:hypothetical protein EYZ11_004126 [Aspergillus tanneri]|uniref:Fe2OG dioxygenase domain-containing protein n=1 Tax=Aspergillus tanneri TaxID=1220188 RepID=A0A4S3JLK9_9EURO|nr:uncharacterized protein ATNIH1004_001004 [Aspergillus tanneri]KAA8652100.1 hypothetical protein ATNIH1004_001004 [Aspergillus tanneri]THC96392.1 hypothetical protein EYZ11_004126 [Aspergillus tanneri]